MKRIFISVFAILIVFGCSSQELVRVARIASTGDAASARRMAAEKAVKYAVNPKTFERDVKRFKADFKALVKTFRKAVAIIWGNKEVKEPEPRKYVKYIHNYLSRASVDFDRGIVRVETLEQKQHLENLKRAIITTVLTPNDPRAVDIYSAKAVKLGATPFLYKEIKDHNGKDIRWEWRAEHFADYLIKNRLQARQIRAEGKDKTIWYVTFPMVKDHLHIRAGKYRQSIGSFASRYHISRNLVFAIIKTESDFNPYAVSSAPAFGLMQIVPGTAGSDVNRYLKKPGIPSKQFLFHPENNIQYGTAYLHLLDKKYLNGIRDPVSREYCTIAAYNTGAGNVLRVFDKDRDRAADRINDLNPLHVYNTLRENLTHKEARRYLVKVLNAKKLFVGH